MAELIIGNVVVGNYTWEGAQHVADGVRVAMNRSEEAALLRQAEGKFVGALSDAEYEAFLRAERDGRATRTYAGFAGFIGFGRVRLVPAEDSRRLGFTSSENGAKTSE